MKKKGRIYRGNSRVHVWGKKWGKRVESKFRNSTLNLNFLPQRMGKSCPLCAIFPKIPGYSNDRLSVDGFDQTHRPCARRGVHPRYEGWETRLLQGITTGLFLLLCR
ncbi:hypothetical protein R3W88_009644 [Solanum pinnatisectum]|uniref:Uncharacterized protein n=1 Tax=Solanum pinnatisectum TaxID=50273 RepID=A0AAV9MBU9_9SOLN|nr:hypothetical protein R3W88_009644 [Solanum pinnatisectum]